MIPFRLFITAPDSIFADLYSSLPWFSTFDCWERISSDPCRTILKQFFDLIRLTYPIFVQTFQDINRMELLTSIIELRPISYRIPECCHHGEQQRIDQHHPILCHEHRSLESSRRIMKAICLPLRNRTSFWAFCSSRPTFFLNWEF